MGRRAGRWGLSLSTANELPGDADTSSHSSHCAEQHGNPGRVNALSAQLEKSGHAILEPRETSLEASGHMSGAHTLLTTVLPALKGAVDPKEQCLIPWHAFSHSKLATVHLLCARHRGEG